MEESLVKLITDPYYYGNERTDANNEGHLRVQFIKSLNLDYVVEQLFEFKIASTNQVFSMLTSLNRDHHVITRLQNALRYFMDVGNTCNASRAGRDG